MVINALPPEEEESTGVLSSELHGGQMESHQLINHSAGSFSAAIDHNGSEVLDRNNHRSPTSVYSSNESCDESSSHHN